MPEVLLSPGTWRDQDWSRDHGRLPSEQKSLIDKSLAGLHAALQRCRHPRDTDTLQEWSPAEYYVSSGLRAAGEWTKYKLGDRDNSARVIVLFRPKEDKIYLVARTITHDYRHLRELAEKFSIR